MRFICDAKKYWLETTPSCSLGLLQSNATMYLTDESREVIARTVVSDTDDVVELYVPGVGRVASATFVDLGVKPEAPPADNGEFYSLGRWSEWVEDTTRAVGNWAVPQAVLVLGEQERL